MGGKGQRRREKNYRAAHGGDSRLPPPPDPGAVDAVPSKLRHLMQLMKRTPSKPGTSDGSKDSGSSRYKGIRPGKWKDETKADENKRDAAEVTNTNTHDKKKQKRKRKDVKDLRFQDLDQGGGARKQKRKEYFEARKKKQNKEKKSEISEFPSHEKISFGEVVEAPPRLSFPKGITTVYDASCERRRLSVIEAYRNHKGWESRPGTHLPSIMESLSP